MRCTSLVNLFDINYLHTYPITYISLSYIISYLIVYSECTFWAEATTHYVSGTDAIQTDITNILSKFHEKYLIVKIVCLKRKIISGRGNEASHFNVSNFSLKYIID